MDRHIADCMAKPDQNLVWSNYQDLESEFDHHFTLKTRRLPTENDKPELAGFIFQIRRGFFHTHHALIGQSEAMRKLRARCKTGRAISNVADPTGRFFSTKSGRRIPRSR